MVRSQKTIGGVVGVAVGNAPYKIYKIGDLTKGIKNKIQAKRKNKLPKRLNTSPTLILAATKKLADKINKAHPQS